MLRKRFWHREWTIKMSICVRQWLERGYKEFTGDKQEVYTLQTSYTSMHDDRIISYHISLRRSIIFFSRLNKRNFSAPGFTLSDIVNTEAHCGYSLSVYPDESETNHSSLPFIIFKIHQERPKLTSHLFEQWNVPKFKFIPLSNL